MPLCRRGELTDLWQALGLDRVAEEPLTIRMTFPSFDDYWQPVLRGQGPAGSYTVSLPARIREALRSRLCDRLAGGRQVSAFTLTARAWAVRGLVSIC